MVGYDVDPRRVKSLAAGQSFVEDVADSELARHWTPGTIAPPTAAAAGFDSA